MFILLAAVALGQDAPDRSDDFDYEITVYGDSALRQARWDVVIGLKRMGWDPVDKPDGVTVFKPPRGWLGRARLDAEGNLDFGYKAVAFQSASAVEPARIESNPHFERDVGGHLIGASEGAAIPGGQAGFWLLPSRRICNGVYARVREQLAPSMDQYRRVQRDTLVREQLDALPERLDRLWSDGEPLVGAREVTSRSERRRQVLAFWATRADTFEGRQVTSATERWIRNVMQESEWPATEAEISEAEQNRADGRPLDIRSR